MRLVLDTGVLGQVVHPRRYAEVRAWLGTAVEILEVLVSEICDYELRRELLRLGASRSLSHLDELARELRYLPVTTTVWRSAARLWVWHGVPASRPRVRIRSTVTYCSQRKREPRTRPS